MWTSLVWFVALMAILSSSRRPEPGISGFLVAGGVAFMSAVLNEALQLYLPSRLKFLHWPLVPVTGIGLFTYYVGGDVVLFAIGASVATIWALIPRSRKPAPGPKRDVTKP